MIMLTKLVLLVSTLISDCSSIEVTDTLDSDFKVVLDIPRGLSESSFLSIVNLCDSLGIEIDYFPIYKLTEETLVKKKKPTVEFKLCPGLGCTWGIINKEVDLGPTISIGWEITF